MKLRHASYLALLLLALPVTVPAELLSDRTLLSDTDHLPDYLQDRGTGVPLSMFGTYINKDQFYIYPFLEYYRDNDYEYSPEELGFNLDQDFLGEYHASEALIFIGYGVSDNVALELEAAFISATLEKAPDDPTAVPDKIEESGLGDVEGQVRWRWREEDDKRAELFSYFETVFPLQKDKLIIGTQDWEFKLGVGATKGYQFGTVTGRIAVEYDRSESATEIGEYAVEYLKKLSHRWRVYAGIEGSQDEVELIAEAQLHMNRNLFFKFNSAVGLTEKAIDWAPEIGVMFSY
jgi:hypothetical protein